MTSRTNDSPFHANQQTGFQPTVGVDPNGHIVVDLPSPQRWMAFAGNAALDLAEAIAKAARDHAELVPHAVRPRPPIEFGTDDGGRVLLDFGGAVRSLTFTHEDAMGFAALLVDYWKDACGGKVIPIEGFPDTLERRDKKPH